jgi:hypothetical protein
LSRARNRASFLPLLSSSSFPNCSNSPASSPFDAIPLVVLVFRSLNFRSSGHPLVAIYLAKQEKEKKNEGRQITRKLKRASRRIFPTFCSLPRTPTAAVGRLQKNRDLGDFQTPETQSKPHFNSKKI